MNKIQLLILLVLSIVVLVTCAVAAALVSSSLVPATPAAPSVTTTPAILSFMGNGDDFVIFDNAVPGLALFFIKHTGDHFFAATLKNSDGHLQALLANDIGVYEGETTEHLERGQYVLEIKADGPWLVVIGLPE